MDLSKIEYLQPVFNSLGWALLHFLWQGTLIAILARAVMMIFLQKRAANLRYLLMCAALVLMLFSPVITFSLIYGSERERILNVDETRLVNKQPGLSAAVTASENPRIYQPFGGNNNEAESYGSSLILKFEASFPWLVLLWLAGIFILSARLAVNWLAVRRLASDEAKQLIEWQPAVNRLARTLGISKSVKLLESSIVRVPVTVGWLKPVILFPFGMVLSLTPQQLESIIAHELAHIRRYDYLVNIFQTIAEILLFYHPAVLWLSKQIRFEREYACDDLAVNVLGGDALCYARALTKVERIRKAAPVLATAATGGGSLESRVRRLVDASDGQNPTSAFSGVVILLTIFAAAALAWQTFSAGKFLAPILNNRAAALSPENGAATGRLGSARLEEVSAPEAISESFPGEDKHLRAAALSALGKHKGSVIIMNPNTGRLYTIVNQDWALREEWSPASVFKIITALSALDEAKITAGERISIPDLNEKLTLTEALTISRNEYFEIAGKRVGANKLLAYAREFGLGEPTQVNFAGEADGYLPATGNSVDAGHLGMYGEQVKMTPMQIAVMTSALANNGNIVVPFAGEAEKPARVRRRIKISPESISTIVRSMRSAVETGTGKGAYTDSFAVAGKTGTVRIENMDTGLFASFAPIENPRFVVVVAIREPAANGLAAAEIAGKIYRILGEIGEQ